MAAEAQQLAGDLQFVRQVVEKREREPRTPLGIPVLWGFIVLGGCIWIDLSPVNCWMYWLVAPVVGFVLSRVIGGRAALAVGEYDAEEGRRMGLHWGSIFVAALPVVLLAMRGKLPNGFVMGQLLILVSGIVYFLAGVHFDRRWMLPGLVMMVGAGVLTFAWPFQWTMLGVAIFLSLVVGFSMRKSATTV